MSSFGLISLAILHIHWIASALPVQFPRPTQLVCQLSLIPGVQLTITINEFKNKWPLVAKNSINLRFGFFILLFYHKTIEKCLIIMAAFSSTIDTLFKTVNFYTVPAWILYTILRLLYVLRIIELKKKTDKHTL